MQDNKEIKTEEAMQDEDLDMVVGSASSLESIDPSQMSGGYRHYIVRYCPDKV